MERRDEGPLTARVLGGEFARIKAGVGDVAAAPARDAHFRQELRATFVNRYFVGRIGLGAGNSGKKTCRSAAHDRNFFAGHS